MHQGSLWQSPAFPVSCFCTRKTVCGSRQNGMTVSRYACKSVVVEYTSASLHFYIFVPLLRFSTKQKAIEENTPGATIIPVIISSDKTQITLFRNKSAYPVYLTIGNLPKSIRRKPSRQGQILLAYLPCTCLLHITNMAAH